MNGIVIYDTSHGNNKMIAEAVAETLKESSFEVALSYVKNVKKLGADDYDFLVIGSPTRMGMMSFAVRWFINGKIKGKDWKDKPFAAFGTNLAQSIEKNGPSAAEKIARKLVGKGLRQILPVLRPAVLGISGPLREGEVEKAKEWTHELASKLKEK
jgi:menaquinone-dependent protoporphyrinogen IX oxidase